MSKVSRRSFKLVLLLGLSLSAAAGCAQSVFLFHDEVLPHTNAAEHIVSYNVFGQYQNRRVSDTRQFGPTWDLGSIGGTASIRPQFIGNASAQSNSDAVDQPKVQLLAQLGAALVSDRNYLQSRVSGRAKAQSQVRKGYLLKEYVAYPNKPTHFLGADITFSLQNVSMSNLSFVGAGLWVTNQGEHWNQAKPLMNVECDPMRCVFTHFAGPKAMGPNNREFVNGANVVYKATFPEIQPGKVLWWMGPYNPGDSGRRPPHAVASAEETMEADRMMGPWRKTGRLWYTLEVSALRSSHGGWR